MSESLYSKCANQCHRLQKFLVQNTVFIFELRNLRKPYGKSLVCLGLRRKPNPQEVKEMEKFGSDDYKATVLDCEIDPEPSCINNNAADCDPCVEFILKLFCIDVSYLLELRKRLHDDQAMFNACSIVMAALLRLVNVPGHYRHDTHYSWLS